MRTMLKLKTLRVVLLLALVALIAACSGDSPTAPNPGPIGNPPGGGTTTPTGVAVTLTTSNLTPLIASTSVVTATVTNNGAPVANGTAVEFTTTFGTFQETGTASVLRTTTNGVATATLTSPTVGPATVTVRVDNVVRTAVVTFREQTTGTTAAITGLSPASGPAGGGQTLIIQGRGFEGPVRVLIDGKEAQVISQTSTEIRVITPATELSASSQFREAQVVVLTRAGTPEEQRLVAPTTFRYELQILTPIVYSVSPASGPNEGNTRITIFGEGFQSPVRVYFGTAGATGAPLIDQVELEIVQVNFNQIIAVTPPALGLGTPFLSQQVTLRVQNVRSNTDVVLPRAFRYGPLIRITAVGPTQGTYLGGTTVTINGQGFDDPVAVTIGGIAAQPIRVSGTEIVAITGSPILSDCSNVTGPISVTNIEDGASAVAEGLLFTFIVPQPQIVSITPNSVLEGGTFAVAVMNATGTARFQVGNDTVLPGSGTTANGITTFNLVAPSNLVFAQATCTTPAGLAGTRSLPTRFNVTFTNQLGCTDSIPNGVTVTPSAALSACVAAPRSSASISGGNDFGSQQVAAGPTAARNLVVSNSGGTPLIVSSVTATGDFQVSGAPQTIAPGASGNFPVTFDPSAAGPRTGTITLVTNETTQPPAINVTGTGTNPPAASTSVVSGGSDFGSQPVAAGPTAPRNFVVTNSGGSDLIISNISTTGDFAVTPGALPRTVAAGASTSFPVTFDPSALGARTGTVVLSTNETTQPTPVNVTGTGT